MRKGLLDLLKLGYLFSSCTREGLDSRIFVAIHALLNHPLLQLLINYLLVHKARELISLELEFFIWWLAVIINLSVIAILIRLSYIFFLLWLCLLTLYVFLLKQLKVVNHEKIKEIFENLNFLEIQPLRFLHLDFLAILVLLNNSFKSVLLEKSSKLI